MLWYMPTIAGHRAVIKYQQGGGRPAHVCPGCLQSHPRLQ